MKKIIKNLLFIILQMLGYNRKILEFKLARIKQKLGRLDFDEVYIIREIFNKTKNGVLFDVGAHSGTFFGHFIDLNYKIFAFEPDPSKEKQDQLLSYIQFQQIKVYNLAVSNKDDLELKFYISDESSGISSLHPFTKNHKEICTVKTIRIDSFMKNNNITKINILKIDTEGYDFFVLQSVEWEGNKPEFIMCEFEDRKTISLGYNFFDLGNFLIQKGYIVFVSEWEPLERYGKRSKWLGFKQYPCKLEYKNSWGNFLCLNIEANKSLKEKFFKILSKGND